ncbi:MAG: DUF882 domain-containing protein [Rhodospirillaceae bacterium]
MSVVAKPALASPPRPMAEAARALQFHNLHTGEALHATYWERGRYRPDALGEINYLLRDHRTGDVGTMAPALLDLLHRLHRVMRSHEPFEVISGYRSPKTNAALAARSGGVATDSLHMRGMAIDVRLPGRALRDLHMAALNLKGGGVGYYRKSNFIHLDVGAVRRW